MMVSEKFMKTMRGSVKVNYNDDRSPKALELTAEIKDIKNGTVYLSDTNFVITKIRVSDINQIKNNNKPNKQR